MAVGRISVKTGSKGKASPHVSYILREDKYKPHAKKVEELGKTGHGNMPQWAEKNPKLFWQEADTHERKNGSTYREHILTLPRELNEEQRIELVEEWIKNEIGDKHPYIYAMHNPIALDGKEQPHCHLMFCERELDGIERSPDQFFKRYNAKSPEKGGAKKANTGLDYSVRRQQLKEQRSRWEKTVNLHLERAGSKERVNLKNWKEKGLTEKPVNINMIEMSKLKKSQQDLKKAQFEVYKVLQTTPTVELNKQNRLAKEAQQKQQEQKAELIKAQLEKMGEDKGLVYDSLYKKMATGTDDKLQEFKQTHIEQAEQLEQKAQHEILTDKELMDYSISKKYVNSIEQIQQERTAPAVTTSPPQEQKEAHQKAELVKAQLEKMGEDKGLVYDSLYKKMATGTDDKLQEFKQTHIEQAEQLEQKAQHEILTDKELMDYSISKKYVNSIEQIQQERTAPAVTTSPPAHPAEKVADMPPPQPQEQTPPAEQLEQLGHGLSEKDESNIKGMREIIKATFANDPAKLKIALERLDKQAEAVSRGEIKLSDKSFVTKEAPKFDYERANAEQVGQDKGKDR